MTSTMVTIPATPRVTTTVRVAAYCRVSDLTGRLPGSLAAQVSYFHRLIASTPGWEEAGVYSDLGITGTSTAHREGFHAMMDAARAGEFEILLVKSVSRLARNTVDLLTTIRELKALGVAVRFERENIDTSTASGELLLTLLASFAQEESQSLSENVKWAIRKRFETGGTNSFVLFGYTWAGERFVIQEKEAALVRRAYQEFLEGINPDNIADTLNAEGLRTRNGARFLGNGIRRWLENPRYKGCQMLQGTYVDGVRGPCVSNNGVLPAYWVEQALPAIIDEATWQRVHDELAARRASGGRGRTPTGGTGALTHRVVCSVCHRKFHRRTRSRKTGSYKFWWCETATRGQGNPCHAPQVREEELKDTVAGLLGHGQFDDEFVLTQVDQICITPQGCITVSLADSTELSGILPSRADGGRRG